MSGLVLPSIVGPLLEKSAISPTAVIGEMLYVWPKLSVHVFLEVKAPTAITEFPDPPTSPMVVTLSPSANGAVFEFAVNSTSPPPGPPQTSTLVLIPMISSCA